MRRLLPLLLLAACQSVPAPPPPVLTAPSVTVSASPWQQANYWSDLKTQTMAWCKPDASDPTGNTLGCIQVIP
jgi:hypothetical protein